MKKNMLLKFLLLLGCFSVITPHCMRAQTPDQEKAVKSIFNKLSNTNGVQANGDRET